MQAIVLAIWGIIIALVVIPPLLVFFLVKERRLRFLSASRVVAMTEECENFRQRFSRVFNLDAELARLKVEIDSIGQVKLTLNEQQQAELQVHHVAIAEIRKQYAEKRFIYDRLRAEVAIFDERLAFAEMGVYEPHFDFDDSDKFKVEIESVYKSN